MLPHIRGEKDDLQIQKPKRGQNHARERVWPTRWSHFFYDSQRDSRSSTVTRKPWKYGRPRYATRRREPRRSARHVALPRWSVRWRSPHRPGGDRNSRGAPQALNGERLPNFPWKWGPPRPRRRESGDAPPPATPEPQVRSPFRTAGIWIFRTLEPPTVGSYAPPPPFWVFLISSPLHRLELDPFTYSLSLSISR